MKENNKSERERDRERDRDRQTDRHKDRDRPKNGTLFLSHSPTLSTGKSNINNNNAIYFTSMNYLRK